MAYNRLWPEREGSIKRARALGVGSVLHTGPPLGEGWTTIHKAGKISLAVLDAPSGIASAGCVTRQLRGNNAALSDWLVDALKTPEGVDSILDLDRLTALEITREAGLHESRPAPGCSTEDAKVTARRVRSGEVVGRVDAPSPIDLVVHVTAFPSWRVWIDGALTPTFQVAPGFVAVRVAPGSHSFRAMGGVLPSYPYVLGGAFILLAAASALLSGRLPPGPAAPPVPPPQRGWGLLTALRAKISKYRR
jgi:hypothetical protein